MSDLPIVSHQTALQGYWWQLEQTPHRRIAPSVMAYTGRAVILRDKLRDESYTLQVNFEDGHREFSYGRRVECPVVPVGGQGLTEQERTWCAYAGQAMAALFAEEAVNG